MEIEETVQIQAYKLDGACYRRWHATVEAVEADRVVVVAPVGHRVQDANGPWTSDHAIRAFYWRDRPYSMLEVYAPDGTLAESYLNIASPARIEASRISFVDHELDVSRLPPHEARIVDEEELLEALARYRCPPEFRRACYRAAKEALEVANRWVPRGIPAEEA